MKNAIGPAANAVVVRAFAALLLFACFAMPSGARADTKRIPAHEDIWLMKRVGAPVVSPDGRWIVVSVVEPAYDENAQLSDLWLIDTSARDSSRRLTSTRRAEDGVTWSADSHRILFSAQRDNDDAPQIYSLDLAAGGEAQRLTSLSGGGPRAGGVARRPATGLRLDHVPGCARRCGKQGEDPGASRSRNPWRASTTASRYAAGITGSIPGSSASS